MKPSVTQDPENMTGPELLEYIAQFPTLDQYLDRDPYAVPLTDSELLLLIQRQRAERALFNIKEQKKRDKKAGVDTDVPSDDGEAEASE